MGRAQELTCQRRDGQADCLKAPSLPPGDVYGQCRALRVASIVRSFPWPSLPFVASPASPSSAPLSPPRAPSPPPLAPQPDATVDMAKILQPGPAAGTGDGRRQRRAGRRIRLAHLPALRRLQQGDLPSAEEGVHRHRQGAFHLPRIRAQHPRRRRLRARPLPRRRQDLRRRRTAVRRAGQVGLRRQAARAADRRDAPDRHDAGAGERVPQESEARRRDRGDRQDAPTRKSI